MGGGRQIEEAPLSSMTINICDGGLETFSRGSRLEAVKLPSEMEDAEGGWVTDVEYVCPYQQVLRILTSSASLSDDGKVKG